MIPGSGLPAAVVEEVVAKDPSPSKRGKDADLDTWPAGITQWRERLPVFLLTSDMLLPPGSLHNPSIRFRQAAGMHRRPLVSHLLFATSSSLPIDGQTLYVLHQRCRTRRLARRPCVRFAAGAQSKEDAAHRDDGQYPKVLLPLTGAHGPSLLARPPAFSERGSDRPLYRWDLNRAQGATRL